MRGRKQRSKHQPGASPTRRWRLVWLGTLLLVWLLCSGTAWAGPLTQRVATFPDWPSKPVTQPAKGDLVYPDWFAGTWNVTTTLVDLVAPLAPAITTPGFASNRRLLGQPVQFQARFLPEREVFPDPSQRWRSLSNPIIADRAFNGRNLAKAYLEKEGAARQKVVLAVQVDPHNPNRQITKLRDNHQLVSTVTNRATEAPSDQDFITTEVFQQEFRGGAQIYFNTVETTTAYHHQFDPGQPAIVADQITAVYLSPQDADYFKAGDRPVALYRYRLDFVPVSKADAT